MTAHPPRFPPGGWLQPVVFAAALAGCGFAAGPARAASDCVISATSISFGSYNVFSLPSVPNDNGIGAVSVGCSGGTASSFAVTLSPGQSGSYAARKMNSGANRLTYNLYTSAARVVVWGDGSGGSGVMNIPRKSTRTFSVYGRIPGGQDAAVGTYTDLVIATVIF